MVLPLFHVSGLSILMRSLYNGTAMTIMESYDEEQVLQYIHDGHINMMSLVPTILKKFGTSHYTSSIACHLIGR